MAIDGAQCRGVLEAELVLLAGDDPVAAWDAELGLRGVIAGPSPLLAEGRSLVALDDGPLVLSALKPAEDGGGIVVRCWNPTASAVSACLRLGFAVASASAVALDETPIAGLVGLDGDVVRVEVPPYALRSVRLVPR
jgi:alpha-mannosidase